MNVNSYDAVRIVLLPDPSQPVHVPAVHLSQWRPKQHILCVMSGVPQVLSVTVADPGLISLSCHHVMRVGIRPGCLDRIKQSIL